MDALKLVPTLVGGRDGDIQVNFLIGGRDGDIQVNFLKGKRGVEPYTRLSKCILTTMHSSSSEHSIKAALYTS